MSFLRRKETISILIVDDNEMGPLSLSELLDNHLSKAKQRYNLRYPILPDPQEALPLIDELKDQQPVRLIISDLSFGEDPTEQKFEAMIRTLSSHHIALPIIVFSAYCYKPTADHFTPGGPRLIRSFEKPLLGDKQEELFREITNVIIS